MQDPASLRPALNALLVVCLGCSTATTQDLPFDAGIDVPADGTTERVDPTGDGDCPDGFTLCGDSCVDLMSDPDHCGSCDNACPGAENADPVCTGGTCSTACREGYVDLDGDGDCETACTPTSDTETCNGLDDNCNGEIDEGFDCASGALVACTTTCGTEGEGFCGEDCTLPSADACTPPVETCNGLDDDCDGDADNGFDCPAGQLVPCTTTCGTTGEGRCHDDCTLPTVDECGIGLEVCNGEDDNCNGAIDEGYPCAAGASVPCTTTCGSSGTGTCSSTCTLPLPTDCTPPAETCNGLDDDCVGGADDTFACVMGTSVSCTTTCGSTGSGTCSTTCTLPSPSSCTPPAETCNGLDDDCTGYADDGTGMECVRGTTGISCTTPGGGLPGTQDCSGSCTLGDCCASTDPCNGYDDDCDTIPDPGCCTALDTCGCAGSASVPGTYTGSTSSMADDYHGGCGSTGGLDVVYSFTLTTSTFVHLDTVGSSFDTVLYLYGSSCGTGTPIECDDDGAGYPVSEIERTLSAGTYYVVVDGYSSSHSGSYVLNISGSGGGGGETCSSPLTYSWPGTTSGSTATAVNDYTASCGGSAGSPDIVYRLVVPSTRTVTMDTDGSGYDTVLHLRDSTCVIELACDDDGGSGLQSYISTSLSAGTYYIIVDGYSTYSSGSYILTVAM
jgi:hypothetical protein